MAAPSALRVVDLPDNVKTIVGRDFRLYSSQPGRVLFSIAYNGGGGGVGILGDIENGQLIDFPRRSKRRKQQNCGELERIWNARFFICQTKSGDG
jgi:hypothetical protein